MSVGDKVAVRYTDALKQTVHFEGTIVERNGSAWKVDIGGLRFIVEEKDLTRL